MSELTLENIPSSELKEMMDNAMHLGHKSEKWNPKIKRFLYAEKNGVHIFDLRKTYMSLQKALEFVESLGAEGKTLMFINTKPQAQKTIIDAAKECDAPYVDSKWLPGLLTNFKTIKSRIAELKKLEGEEASGELEEKYLKKEVSMIKKEILKLKDALGGVANLTKVPNAIFVTDIKRDHIPVQEALRLNIPVIAITDSNTDPSEINFPIPANDDSIKSIQYVVDKIKESFLQGKNSFNKKK